MELIKIINKVKSDTLLKEQEEKRIEELVHKLSLEIRETRINRMMEVFESGKNISYKAEGKLVSVVVEIEDYDIESSPKYKEIVQMNPDNLESITSQLKRVDVYALKEYLNVELNEKGAPKCIDLYNLVNQVGVLLKAIFEIN